MQQRWCGDRTPLEGALGVSHKFPSGLLPLLNPHSHPPSIAASSIAACSCRSAAVCAAAAAASAVVWASPPPEPPSPPPLLVAAAAAAAAARSCSSSAWMPSARRSHAASSSCCAASSEAPLAACCPHLQQSSAAKRPTEQQQSSRIETQRLFRRARRQTAGKRSHRAASSFCPPLSTALFGRHRALQLRVQLAQRRLLPPGIRFQVRHSPAAAQCLAGAIQQGCRAQRCRGQRV